MRKSLLSALLAGTFALSSAAQAETCSFAFTGNPEPAPGACAKGAAAGVMTIAQAAEPAARALTPVGSASLGAAALRRWMGKQ